MKKIENNMTETVNFPALIKALKHCCILNIEFSEPNMLIANKNLLIKIDNSFLKTDSWSYPFHNKPLEILNILGFENIITRDLRTKNNVLFHYDMETITLEGILKGFGTADH